MIYFLCRRVFVFVFVCVHVCVCVCVCVCVSQLRNLAQDLGQDQDVDHALWTQDLDHDLASRSCSLGPRILAMITNLSD